MMSVVAYDGCKEMMVVEQRQLCVERARRVQLSPNNRMSPVL